MFSLALELHGIPVGSVNVSLRITIPLMHYHKLVLDFWSIPVGLVSLILRIPRKGCHLFRCPLHA